jgi:hypothetical protein
MRKDVAATFTEKVLHRSQFSTKPGSLLAGDGVRTTSAVYCLLEKHAAIRESTKCNRKARKP